MKREVKFRGKKRSDGLWAYGLPEYTSGGCIGRIGGWHESGDDSMGGFFTVEVIDETITQFAGLHDNNGREIYEGDIVSDGKTIYTVEYNTQQSGFWIIAQKTISNESFVIMTLNSNTLGNGYYKRNDIEVIGNIFENPELLS